MTSIEEYRQNEKRKLKFKSGLDTEKTKTKVNKFNESYRNFSVSVRNKNCDNKIIKDNYDSLKSSWGAVKEDLDDEEDEEYEDYESDWDELCAKFRLENAVFYVIETFRQLAGMLKDALALMMENMKPREKPEIQNERDPFGVNKKGKDFDKKYDNNVLEKAEKGNEKNSRGLGKTTYKDYAEFFEKQQAIEDKKAHELGEKKAREVEDRKQAEQSTRESHMETAEPTFAPAEQEMGMQKD